MFCEKCGSQLQDDEKFCPYCGTPVEPDEYYGQEETQAGTYEQEYQQQNDQGQNIYEQDYPEQDGYSEYGQGGYEDHSTSQYEYQQDYDSTDGMGYGYPGGYQDDYQDPGYYEEEPEVETRKPVGIKKKKNAKQDRDLEEEWAKEEKKDKITFVILGVVIVALIVVIFFVVRSLISNDSDKDTVDDNQQIQTDVTVAPDTPEPTNTPTPTEETPTPTEEAETPTPTAEATPTIKVTPQAVTPAPTVTPSAGQSATASDDYIIADSSTRYLSESDLSSLTEWEIRIARNEIFARHGRKFTTQELQDYFDGKDWYKGTVAADKFDTDVLNAIEKANLQLIVEYEKKHNLNQ